MNIHKTIFIYLLLLVFIFVIADDASAQRRKKRKRRDAQKEHVEVQEKTISDNINYEIKLGNISFQNYFLSSFKANAGYKLHERITAGLGGRFAYYYSFNQKFSTSNYGAFAFARVKVINGIYAQVEYIISNEIRSLNKRRTYKFPAFGAGYMGTVTDTWSYGAELLYTHREIGALSSTPFEYWLNFSYRF